MPEAVSTPPAAPVAAASQPTPVAALAAPKSPQAAAFDEIDQISAEPPKSSIRSREVPKPSDKTVVEPTKPVEAPKTGVVPPPDENKPKSSVGILKENYEKTKVELRTAKEELQKLKTAKPVEDTDKPLLLEKSTRLEKENSELKERLKYSDYERSDEFNEKYKKPYEDTAQSAVNRVTQLKVPNPNGEPRNFTQEEFWSIVGTGNENDALEKAESIFGEGSSKANAVIERRNEVLAAWRRGEQAKEDFKKGMGEREKAESEKTALQRTQEKEHQTKMATMFQELNKSRIESKPEYNKADEGDTHGQKVINMGDAMAALGFGFITPEKVEHLPEAIRKEMVNGELTPEGRVKFHSAMASAIRERPFIALKLNRITAERDALKKQLDEFKASGPNNGGDGRRTKGAKNLSHLDELDELSAKGPAMR